MSKEVAGEESVYFEMESKQATGAGLYDDLVERCAIPGTKQANLEKNVAEKSEQISTGPANSNSPLEAVILKRLLCIIVAVVAVCFLISAVTLILALTMMISARSTPITSIDCGGAAVQAPSPRGEPLGGSDSTEGPKDIVTPSPPVVSPLENMISELKRNFSVFKTFMIQNISQQLDASVSAINVSFFQELDSVRTTFDSKLNNTAQNLSDADSLLLTLLNTINSSLSSQVQSISKLRGPTGPPGFNASQGDSGQEGPKGQKGEPGQTGSNGGPGLKGDPGINGTDGVAGQQGNIGPKGDKGEPGTPGQQGAQGPPGPQGPQGAGNFSQCFYKKLIVFGISGAEVVVDVIEQVNQKFLGVTCSTTNAAEYNLEVLRRPNDNLLLFKCTCKGTSTLFIKAGHTECTMHYWECPMTT